MSLLVKWGIHVFVLSVVLLDSSRLSAGEVGFLPVGVPAF